MPEHGLGNIKEGIDILFSFDHFSISDSSFGNSSISCQIQISNTKCNINIFRILSNGNLICQVSASDKFHFSIFNNILAIPPATGRTQ